MICLNYCLITQQLQTSYHGLFMIIQENMKQMQEANARQVKEMQEHHETVMKERMAEQARLLQEGFEKEADHLKELIR